MRHRCNSLKLGRTSQHRDMMLGSMVASLIKHNRIRTTQAKAKAAARLADKVVTLGKRGDLAARRRAAALLRQEDAVVKLFASVAPAFQARKGGYTRVTKLVQRQSDGAPMALLEWTETVIGPEKTEVPAPADAKKPAGEKKA
jgi:large subunit ribosomal protein L17